ncbi:11808_t:CDS:2 [Entrophospora sp. SA101]|nr:2696_t:CDS:2 [Entrophospora sp. SA101]CAJ0638169.1 11808_t:CDS:2 [Entrophospora sp. SA101]CAJ0824263.1 19577_t:CDS:2 [Entrophospora sp. SA101]CAJ0834735.1 2_t:CDS:2 [Entrophospora sp. SA101]CAJ0912962.1 3576_t:CDS:2 [Entrophospora sp. SA101]
MAGVSVTVPNFSGDLDEDINTFIKQFKGFLNNINIDVTNMLTNIYDNHDTNTLANLQAHTMVQMIVTNSFRPHPSAHAYANIGTNKAVTVRAAETRKLTP